MAAVGKNQGGFRNGKRKFRKTEGGSGKEGTSQNCRDPERVMKPGLLKQNELRKTLSFRRSVMVPLRGRIETLYPPDVFRLSGTFDSNEMSFRATCLGTLA